MRRLFVSAFVVLYLSTALLAGKKNKFVLYTLPDQNVELGHIAEVRAEQPCDNWRWASGLETILRRQKVDLDQRYWVLKLNGGLPCLDSPGTFYDLKRQIDGEYVLGDGRHVKLEVRYIEHLPETMDGLVLPIAQGRPYMIWWKGHPFVVKGAVWHELVYQTGQKFVEMTSLMLINTAEVGGARDVVFNRSEDNSAELGAMFDVIVTELDSNPWAPPHNPATEPVKNPAYK